MQSRFLFLTSFLLCIGLSAPSSAKRSRGKAADPPAASASEEDTPSERASRRRAPVPCPLNARALEGDPGDTRTVLCPADCAGPLVWGTDIYADDSSICAAARHAGVIDGSSDAEVTIEFLPGQKGYQGSTQHGITSFHWGTWPRSFSVHAASGVERGAALRMRSAQASDIIEEDTETREGSSSSVAESGTPFAALTAPASSARAASAARTDSSAKKRNQAVDCSLRGDELPGEIGTRRILRCPSSCNTESVWGVGPYTDDSSVCAAAIHAGAIPMHEGGLVRVITEGPIKNAKASTANGVKSQAWRYWPRSFRIEAVR